MGLCAVVLSASSGCALLPKLFSASTPAATTAVAAQSAEPGQDDRPFTGLPYYLAPHSERPPSTAQADIPLVTGEVVPADRSDDKTKHAQEKKHDRASASVSKETPPDAPSAVAIEQAPTEQASTTTAAEPAQAVAVAAEVKTRLAQLDALVVGLERRPGITSADVVELRRVAADVGGALPERRELSAAAEEMEATIGRLRRAKGPTRHELLARLLTLSEHIRAQMIRPS